MNIHTRPQRKHWFRRLRKRLIRAIKQPLYVMFTSWYKSMKEAESFTRLACPQCEEPATRPDAVFCTFCGIKLADWPPTQLLPKPPTDHFTDVERNTDPFAVLQTTGPMLTPYPGKSPAEIKKIILAHNPPPDRQRPALANIRKWHPDEDAGPQTQAHRAMSTQGLPYYTPRPTVKLAQKKEGE